MTKARTAGGAGSTKRAASPKKTAASKKKIVVERSGGGDPFGDAAAPFREACARTVGPVLQAAGFAEPQVTANRGDLRARYSRGDSAVEVASERFGEPWVIVHLKPGMSFGLHLFLAELEPAWDQTGRPHRDKASLDSTQMSEALADLAAALERHIGAVLSPSPELIARLRERVRAALWAQ